MDVLDNLGIGIYFLIFFGKNLEVSISTMRRVLIYRGERIRGSIIAFIDMVIWLLITGTVLTGFKEDPLRILFFVMAFGTGTFLGSWLEEKLAFGLSSIEIIVPTSLKSKKLATILRDNGFGVTVVKGEGRDGKRDLLKLYLKRNQVEKVKQLINLNYKEAIFVVNDSRKIKGAYSSVKK